MRLARSLAGLALLLAASASLGAGPRIQLNPDCPPGFELDAGHCELRSLYQMYPSLQDAGVGGLKTGLPRYRDGFSPQQIDLGRYLFFDPLLSVDGTQSCASCHQPDKGFADGLGRSVGHNGERLTRSAPSLWNVAFLQSFFWDARAFTLEEQMQGPLYHPKEMANNPVKLLADLNASSEYRRLFAEAFPAGELAADDITLAQIYAALAAFESSLVSLNSRYDQYAHGYADALTDNEKAGLNIFRSFVARCAECHTPPLFTNQQVAVLGTPEPEGMPFDPGAGVINDPTQRGGFKVPSLRNIALTAPYMHSGRFATLKEAAEFYTLGRGHAVPEGEDLKIHWHIWEPKLTDEELDRLVDFMKTLTDESFKPREPELLPSGLAPVHRNQARGGELASGDHNNE
ncbi:cytochrome-c peroxidase [Parahaliea mediterranea]|uniref:cytochrome-c peroxidase n=1 Tax=Parahaliea mediterranea TaxID=651086 RepID=UPI000E2E6A74|nr:cytochrome c peroxidase [Parahaliea mediterranea]